MTPILVLTPLRVRSEALEITPMRSPVPSVLNETTVGQEIMLLSFLRVMVVATFPGKTFPRVLLTTSESLLPPRCTLVSIVPLLVLGSLRMAHRGPYAKLLLLAILVTKIEIRIRLGSILTDLISRPILRKLLGEVLMTTEPPLKSVLMVTCSTLSLLEV